MWCHNESPVDMKRMMAMDEYYAFDMVFKLFCCVGSAFSSSNAFPFSFPWKGESLVPLPLAPALVLDPPAISIHPPAISTHPPSKGDVSPRHDWEDRFLDLAIARKFQHLGLRHLAQLLKGYSILTLLVRPSLDLCPCSAIVSAFELAVGCLWGPAVLPISWSLLQIPSSIFATVRTIRTNIWLCRPVPPSLDAN